MAEAVVNWVPVSCMPSPESPDKRIVTCSRSTHSRVAAGVIGSTPFPLESDLIGVELPEGPQPLLRICTALLQAELNIIQAYPLIVRPHGKPAVAIMVENIELAMETLCEKGFTIITEGDLVDDC